MDICDPVFALTNGSQIPKMENLSEISTSTCLIAETHLAVSEWSQLVPRSEIERHVVGSTCHRWTVQVSFVFNMSMQSEMKAPIVVGFVNPVQIRVCSD